METKVTTFNQDLTLKKQSQFIKEQDVVSVYVKGEYEDIHLFGYRENKANSKPIGGLWPEIQDF